MANIAANSPGRTRSGSLNVASTDTSMLARMRSGSVGCRYVYSTEFFYDVNSHFNL
jgi:hypothetical protein